MINKTGILPTKASQWLFLHGIFQYLRNEKKSLSTEFILKYKKD